MDLAVSGNSTAVGVCSLGCFRSPHQRSDSFRRRKRWRRPEHDMAMVCASWRLETNLYDAVASTARRCRHGPFARIGPRDSLWRTKQRDADERHLGIHALAVAAHGVCQNESTNAVGYDLEKSEIEIGWTFLARKYWGGRYNGEMKELLLAHAFKFVETVVFLVGEHNIRSQRAMEKIGATKVGTATRVYGNHPAATNVKYVMSKSQKVEN